MPDAKDAAKTDAAADEKPGRKLPIKTIAVFAGLLLLEGGIISAIFLMAGKPSDVRADGAAIDTLAEGEQLVEVPLVSGRFQNTRSGRSFLYDTEVYLVTRQKHREMVEQRIEQMQSRIEAEVTTVFARAEPAHLNEPDRTTLRRQLQAIMADRLGVDDDGEPYASEVVVSNLRRFNSDL
jgi:hypothetical protein